MMDLTGEPSTTEKLNIKEDPLLLIRPRGNTSVPHLVIVGISGALIDCVAEPSIGNESDDVSLSTGESYT